jgi:sigma-B regulation protein RsbU (phosphoserine phosphatase)
MNLSLNAHSRHSNVAQGKINMAFTSQPNVFCKPERLAAVYATGLLDTLPDPTFDELTRLASLTTKAPFAFATLVDDARSFWKSSHGLAEGSIRQNTVDESFCQYIIQSEKELIISDTMLDARVSENPSIKSMGVRAWAGFPIYSPDGFVLGSFCVVDTVPRDWTAIDIEILRTLASCACREIALRAMIEQERLVKLRSEALASSLQSSLLPPSLPQIPGWDIAACYQAAGRGIDVVGDFYDVFQSEKHRWSFIMGDVCGKGVDAAKTAALARYSVRTAAMTTREPDKVLSLLNDVIKAHNTNSATFLTAVYGTLHGSGNTHTVRLACGGHAPPIVRHTDGSLSFVQTRGPLVGIFDDFEARETQLALQNGESLLIFTDGVNEARADSTMISEEQIAAILRNASGTAQEIADHILHAVLSYAGGISSDDIAILVLQPTDSLEK